MYPPTRAHFFRQDVGSVLLVGAFAAVIALELSSCATDDVEPDPTLPPDVATPTPESTPYQSGNDDVPPTDQSPEHTLVQLEYGTWSLSGSGYSALSGTLTVTESIDGSEDLSCEVEYFLTGSASTTTCPGCEYTYRILHTLVFGDLEACHRSDLPQDQEYRVLGYVPPGQDGGGFIYYDYNSTGEWLPWYEASRNDNVIDFSWSDTLGVIVE